MKSKDFHKLLKAQLKFAVDHIEAEHWEHSDDGFDYLQGAVDLAAALIDIESQYMGSREYPDQALRKLCPLYQNYACDGISKELSEWETEEQLKLAAKENEDKQVDIEEYIRDFKS